MSADPIAELLALYRLIHADEILAAKQAFLGEGTRLKIYNACETPQSQSDLAISLRVAQPTVSRNVRSLVDAGLLQVERDGQIQRYIQLL